jgi:hypothetical protein
MITLSGCTSDKKRLKLTEDKKLTKEKSKVEATVVNQFLMHNQDA